VNEQHAVAALDGEQIGVPAAERAFGLIIGGIGERSLALEAAGCVQELLSNLVYDHQAASLSD
jgi:hypothetical protein